MSASTGPTSKGEKGKSKYRSLDINSIYHNNRSENSEAQQAKSSAPRRHGMQSLGKVPQRRHPANLPSLRSENSGNDPTVTLVPPGGTGWGTKPGENPTASQPPVIPTGPAPHTNQTQLNTSTSSAVPAVAAVPVALSTNTQPTPTVNHQPATSGSGVHDKTWSSVMTRSGVSGSGVVGHGPSFLAHQSPQFQQEFPSLSGEPGVGQGHLASAATGPSYGPGPSLRPQTEGSWSQGTAARPSSSNQPNNQPPSLASSPFSSVVPSFMNRGDNIPPMFPENIQSMRFRNPPSHSDRMSGRNHPPPPNEPEDDIHRPIIKQEDLTRMEELARDASWAANDDIDYNEKLAFSDNESTEDDKGKEAKSSDMNKITNVQVKEEKKEPDMEKIVRENKPFVAEKNQQPPWRMMNNSHPPSDYRNNPILNPRSQTQNNRVDDDEMWRAKRQLLSEQKMAVAERAKQRKEQEEKRYEESKAKKGIKDNYDSSSSEYHSVCSSIPEWDKEDRLKSSDNFRQMTQNFNVQMPRSNLNRDRERERDRDRDGRRDRDNQGFNPRYHQANSKPPRFRQKEKSGGGQFGVGASTFESKWLPIASHHMRRSGPDVDKDEDYRKDKGPQEGDRFSRSHDRVPDGPKRGGYYESHHDYSSLYQSREPPQEKEPQKDYDFRVNEKESAGEKEEDFAKQWEPSRHETDNRHFEDRLRKEDDDVWKRQQSSGETKLAVPEKEKSFSKATSEEKETGVTVSEWAGDRAENRDRPSRPNSRDSRISKDSRNSRESMPRDEARPIAMPSEDYNWSENDEGILDRHNFKDKEIRREPIPHRTRDHVPGPITPERIEAYEQKNQALAESREKEEKEANDIKANQFSHVEPTGAWSSSHLEVPSSASFQEVSPSVQENQQQDCSNTAEELGKPAVPDDSQDKRKENGGRDRRDDKLSTRGSNRSRGAARGVGSFNTSNAFGTGYRQPQWHTRDLRNRRNLSPRNKMRPYQSESDVSADEVSVSTESGKDEKKSEKKQQTPRSPKSNTWKDKIFRDDKGKDQKGLEGDKSKGEKKPMGTGESGGGMRKGPEGSGGFAPRGEPSRRGRGASNVRGVGQSHIMVHNAQYGPPGSKPFTQSPVLGPPLSQLQIDSQDKQFSPPQPGRKDDAQANKRDGDLKMARGKGRPKLGEEETCDTTSDASDSGDKKKYFKNRPKTDRKPRGAVGDKRGLVNSNQINGRPSRDDGKGDDSGGSEKKMSKDDTDSTSHSNNGFQEVTGRKKIIRDGKPIKDENKRSRSKPKDKVPGIKNLQSKSYCREFVCKPPRMQRMDSMRKHHQQQQEVSDMNKLNQNVSSLFPMTRSNTDLGCPPPPMTNAWNKPITASLSRSTPPLSTSLSQLTSTVQTTITSEKSPLDLGELGPSANAANQVNSPSADKSLSKMTREVVEKGLLDGTTPPVTTIIFENTNFKRDPNEITGLKPRYPAMKGPRMDKDRKVEDDMVEGTHNMSLGGFKSSSDLQSTDSKQEIQVSMTFGKNEDSADIKLDFGFDSDLSQLSDDKTNPSHHVGQTSAADLNQKIASVKKVWDSAPGMGGHMDEGSSSFTQSFTNDKSLEPGAPSHHTDHPDFNSSDSVYSTGGQLSGSGSSYVPSASSIMKQDAVSGANTMCKGSIFPVSAQQVVPMASIGSHPGTLSTPPPIAGVLNYQHTPYSGTLSAVPSPPNVLYNSQQAQHQGDLYGSYPFSTGTVSLHSSGSRYNPEYPPAYGLSQSSSLQAGMFMSQSGPPNQSVFPNHNSQYRLQHAGTSLNQQLSSNPSPVMMSSSSNSMVSGSQVKSGNQPSLQPAIGTKSAGPPAAQPTFPPQHSTQIVLIDSGLGFLQSSPYLPQRPTIQHSSTFYPNASGVPLATGGQTGGLYNSSLLSGGGAGSLPSGGPFGVAGGFSSSNQAGGQPNSAAPTQPPSQLPSQYSTQMSAAYRGQSPYPKSGQQHPGDSAKSPSQEQFHSMFGTAGALAGKTRVGAKPQPSPSPGPPPPPHKFSSYPNPHAVSQASLAYQQGGNQQSGNNGGARPGIGSGMGGAMRGAGSNPPNMGNNGGQNRYMAPIQRPIMAHHQQQQQQMMQQQQQRQQRMRQPSQPPQMNKQYFHQQGGGGLRVEQGVEPKVEPDEASKSQDKPLKEESPTDQ